MITQIQISDYIYDKLYEIFVEEVYEGRADWCHYTPGGFYYSEFNITHNGQLRIGYSDTDDIEFRFGFKRDYHKVDVPIFFEKRIEFTIVGTGDKIILLREHKTRRREQ